MANEAPLILAMPESMGFAQTLGNALGLRVAEFLEKRFLDGERELKPAVQCEGQQVLVVHSLHDDAGSSLDSRICRLLFALQALRDSGARRLALLAPYLAYSRHDRRGEGDDPLMLQHLARLLEASGLSAVMTLDAHNVAAFENAFRVPAWSVDLTELFADDLVQWQGPSSAADWVVVSPDAGGIKRAQGFARALELRLKRPIPLAWVNKVRLQTQVESRQILGDVAQKRVVIVDDQISTGSTLAQAARLCLKQGARSVCAYATHGIFAGDAPRALMQSGIQRIGISDSVIRTDVDSAFLQQRVWRLSAITVLAASVRKRLGGTWLGS
jgi:ribose-phosphate pyrophosphokinase